MERSKDQPATPTPEPKKATPQEFATAYDALCKSMGYQIVVNPAYVKRDDGSFSTVLQVSVGPLAQN